MASTSPSTRSQKLRGRVGLHIAFCDVHSCFSRIHCNLMVCCAAATSTASRPAAAPSKTAELYANSALRPTRVWPNGSPENPLTKVIYWRKAPYVLMKRGGWMRIYGMQSGRAGKVEVILEARGGNQYLLEVPLKQVTWLGLCMPASTLQAVNKALTCRATSAKCMQFALAQL